MKPPAGNNKGFTLIEIAIVMVIIGLLAGAGISLVGTLTKRKNRIEVVQYLRQAKEALITYANVNGTLPLADTNGDGVGDSAASRGALPTLDLGINPTDAHKRMLAYQINSILATDRTTSCYHLRSAISGSPPPGLPGNPTIVDADGSSAAFSVAAVLVSAGPSDADKDGNVFDGMTGTFSGDNRDGLPNYIRAAPTGTFDDLVVYISSAELCGTICEFLVLAVNNSSTSQTAWVHNQTTGNDLDTLAPGDSGQYTLISGTTITLLNAAKGAGTPVDSDPPTPIILSGNGRDIRVQDPPVVGSR